MIEEDTDDHYHSARIIFFISFFFLSKLGRPLPLLCMSDNMLTPATKGTVEIDARLKEGQHTADEGKASKGGVSI